MTGKVIKLVAKTLLAVGILLTAANGYAKDNLCGECHTAREIAAFGNVLNWDRSIYQEKDTVCPGVLSLKRDAYFTESRLVKFNEMLTGLEEHTRRYPEYLRMDLDKAAVSYADLAVVVPNSIEGFSGPNLKIKKDVHSVYEKINKLRDDYKMEKVMGLGLVGVMLVTFLFSLGLKNTLKE